MQQHDWLLFVIIKPFDRLYDTNKKAKDKERNKQKPYDHAILIATRPHPRIIQSTVIFLTLGIESYQRNVEKPKRLSVDLRDKITNEHVVTKKKITKKIKTPMFSP